MFQIGLAQVKAMRGRLSGMWTVGVHRQRLAGEVVIHRKGTAGKGRIYGL